MKLQAAINTAAGSPGDFWNRNSIKGLIGDVKASKNRPVEQS
ncbi:hypothetical protein [Microvirga sp. VF16]|nr:hypothetical protein [Microvirga sp. VF16]